VVTFPCFENKSMCLSGLVVSIEKYVAKI
jgi:hypothetical protein